MTRSNTNIKAVYEHHDLMESQSEYLSVYNEMQRIKLQLLIGSYFSSNEILIQFFINSLN